MSKQLAWGDLLCGVPVTPESWVGGVVQCMNKLSLEQVYAIRSSNGPASVVAPLYGVSKRTICSIRAGETWKDDYGKSEVLAARLGGGK